MKNTQPTSARGLPARALQLLAMHTNTRGEVSTGLEAALELAGAKPSALKLPATVLAAHGLDGSGLLLRGQNASVVWCSDGNLPAIARLAAPYTAAYVANWIGYAATANMTPQASPSRTIGSQSPRGLSTALGLLLLLVLLFTDQPLRASGTESESAATRPRRWVEDNAACGADLLRTIHAAAELAGFGVETSRAPTRFAVEPKFDVILPALVLTRAKEKRVEPLRVPVVAAIKPGQSFTFSIYALAKTVVPTLTGEEITLRLRHKNTDRIEAETTTIIGPGWSRAYFSWEPTTATDPDTLKVEIDLRAQCPVKITFPRAFTVRTAAASELEAKQ